MVAAAPLDAPADTSFDGQPEPAPTPRPQTVDPAPPHATTHAPPMSLALVHSRAQHGVAAPEVRVEVHLAGGLPAMSIVGLPEAALSPVVI